MELVLLAQLDNDQMLNRDHVKKWDLRLRLQLLNCAVLLLKLNFKMH